MHTYIHLHILEVPSIITMVLPDNTTSLLVKFGLSIALVFTYPIAMFPVFEIIEDRSSPPPPLPTPLYLPLSLHARACVGNGMVQASVV
jgi:hypothetical protein